MSANGEATDVNGSSAVSFWDCGGYRNVLDRIQISSKSCSSFRCFVEERKAIEKAYVINLDKLERRWTSYIENGSEYPSFSEVWRALVGESQDVAAVHRMVFTALEDEIEPSIKHWQKEHYHKSALPPHILKEIKEYEHEFESAQKPWAKRIKKVHLSRKEYHNACKTEKAYQVQVQNAKNDPNGTTEQLKKIQDKLAKSGKDVERTCNAYRAALSDLEAVKANYLEKMISVYHRFQAFEKERLEFLTDTADRLHHSLSLIKKASLESVDAKLKDIIEKYKVDEDLAWLSSNHGPDMVFTSPHFEDYSPELHAGVNSKRRTMIHDSNSNVTISNTSISGPTNVTSSNIHVQTLTKSSESNNHSNLPRNPFDDDFYPSNSNTIDNHGASSSQADVTPGNGGQESENLEVDLYSSPTYDDGQPGVKVRALYDYVGQEDDEIGFKAGDIFEKLGEVDEQGWCKGRLNGRVGLYPANYVEEI